MGRVVGIDLGTTYSAVATLGPSGLTEMVRNAEGQTITPSVVYFDGSDVLVGQQAKAQRQVSPGDVVEFVKRQMGNASWSHYDPNGEKYGPEAISALILKKVTQDAALALGEDVTEVVITVPAYFNDAQRIATQQAGEIAGLKVNSVINEPTAAAISFAMDTDFAGTLLVYDLGGGTFDVTVLEAKSGEYTIKATGGDRNLGGFDFDNAIITWAKEEFKKETGVDLESDEDEAMLRDRAEQAKHRLSQAEKAPMFITAQGKNAKLTLTREKFEEITKSLLKRTQIVVDEVIEESGIPLDKIDKVLLVGGSTRMPMVTNMLRETTKQEPDATVHPDEAVARGAAIMAAARVHAAEIQQSKPGIGGESEQAKGGGITDDGQEIIVNDILSHGFGMIALNETLGKEYNAIIVPKGTQTPTKIGQEFYTIKDNQTGLLVRITEGDEEELEYVTVLGKSELKIPPYPKGSPINVILAVDRNNIIHVEVIDLVTNKSLGEFEIKREGSLNEADVKKQARGVAETEVM